MPYTATYVDGGKGVHKQGVGVVTGLEIFSSSMQECLDENRSRQLRYGLIDFTEVTEFKVTPDDVRRIVEMNRKMATFTPSALVAIVAPAALPYAMARLWHTLSDDIGWTSNVFHTRPDAISWLCKQFQARAGTADVLAEYPFLSAEAGANS